MGSDAYRQAFEGSRAPQLLIDPERVVIVDANEAACRFYGHSREAMRGMHLGIINATDFDEVERGVRGLSRTDAAPIPLRHVHADGTVRDVEIYPSWIGEPRDPLIHSVIHDVTERVWASRKLRESEDRFRGIVEQALVGFYTLVQGSWTYVNPGFAQIFGYTPDEIMEMEDFWRIFHPEDQPLVAEMIRQRLGGEVDTVRYSFRGLRKDGSTVHVMVQGTRTLLDGEPAIVGAAIDISDVQRAEAALARSERQRMALLDALPDLAWLKDAGGRYLACNDAFARYLGRSRREILGRRADELVSPGVAARQREAERRVLESGEAQVTEEALPSESEPGRVHEVVRAPFRDERGRWCGLVGIARDVTERKGLEAQLHQAQKMEAVGRLSGGVAHDFNNVLTAIEGYTRLAMEDPGLSEEGREHMDEVMSVARHAAGLTRQLLTFSRKQVVAPEPLDMNVVVGELRKLLSRVIGEDVQLRVGGGEPLPPVVADKGQIEQVLVNLAVNARDAMPGGGRLSITTALEDIPFAHRAPGGGTLTPGRYVRVTVTDSGPGIDPKLRSRIFEPFFTTKTTGTGLGLATAAGIVSRAGGVLDFESTPGEGTSFHLLLPVSSESVAGPVRRERRTVARRGSGTVLVVEDEASIRHLLDRVLRRFGYRVFLAPDGEEAVRIASEQPVGSVDLILTDMVLPGASGVEVVERIRQLWPSVPVVFMSGYTEIPVDLTRLGPGERFVQKPFTPDEIVLELQGLLGSGEPLAERADGGRPALGPAHGATAS